MYLFYPSIQKLQPPCGKFNAVVRTCGSWHPFYSLLIKKPYRGLVLNLTFLSRVWASQQAIELTLHSFVRTVGLLVGGCSWFGIRNHDAIVVLLLIFVFVDVEEVSKKAQKAKELEVFLSPSIHASEWVSIHNEKVIHSRLTDFQKEFPLRLGVVLDIPAGGGLSWLSSSAGTQLMVLNSYTITAYAHTYVQPASVFGFPL